MSSSGNTVGAFPDAAPDAPPEEQPTAASSSTSYSFSQSTLRERHVPLREDISARRMQYFTKITRGESAAAPSEIPAEDRVPPPTPSIHPDSAATTHEPTPSSQPQDQAPTPTATNPAGTSSKASQPPSEDPQGSSFECNICLDMASDPVITLCGHLFCWPCIHRWIEAKLPASNTCPVCKAGLTKEGLIPIYTKGRKHPRDEPEPSIPNRPSGQRPEPPPPENPNPFGFMGDFPLFNGLGFGMMPGVGAFQVGNTTINFGLGFGLIPSLIGLSIALISQFQNRNQPNNAPTAQDQQLFVSRIIWLFGLLAFIYILFS
ncbi:uncharacterized protein BJ171DRAFT_566577 [Polychytrium aggregatum]|uniref:uncharacterized protein n=1 Tax=Polychytrium aggregatum TaxID=110093 RepID=UPI0022FEC305|nr:uncharacterized protein BJ171DRAFT_566577 [Polychytrium aggregatum]KAI9206728.1 hypothetical protein BJ171DRAFT_566577 [Polychytrium aggregatum]